MVYDCFMFFNELELLNIRFHELDPVVDYFVVVESGQTFTGLPKPFIFKDKAAFFQPWVKKIIYINIPVLVGNTTWEREIYQRNVILPSLEKMISPEATFMFSDVDEIPNRHVASKATLLARSGLVVFVHDMFYYHLNRKFSNWNGTRVIKFGDMLSAGLKPQDLRLQSKVAAIVPNAGWHFTYMGGAERIRQKFQSFSHDEYNLPKYTSLDLINHRIDNGIDPIDRPEYKETVVGLDKMPIYVREHPYVFANWLK